MALCNAEPQLVVPNYQEEFQLINITMYARPDKVLNFPVQLLEQAQSHFQDLHKEGAEVHWQQRGGPKVPVRYLVLRSGHPHYFSLGGDLEYFLECIRARNWQALHEYSTLSLELTWRIADELMRDITVIGLVQGRALGGGFELALSGHYLLAEEHSKMGLPEILFGLFPTSGAMSLLARKVHLGLAERMCRNAKLYTARELHEMGIVDEIFPTGKGQEGLMQFVKDHERRSTSRTALQSAKMRMLPLIRAELEQVVDDWVHAATKLTAEELRVLDTLVRMQRAELAH
jgi:DSF synthase